MIPITTLKIRIITRIIFLMLDFENLSGVTRRFCLSSHRSIFIFHHPSRMIDWSMFRTWPNLLYFRWERKKTLSNRAKSAHPRCATSAAAWSMIGSDPKNSFYKFTGYRRNLSRCLTSALNEIKAIQGRRDDKGAGGEYISRRLFDLKFRIKCVLFDKSYVIIVRQWTSS